MTFNSLLAWLYWNPPREIFTIPLINRPIVFYGLFFVFGFVIGYFLITVLFKQKLLAVRKIQEHDIASWPALIKSLQLALNHPGDPLHPITQKMDLKLREELSSFQLLQEANHSQKEQILRAINLILAQSMGREQLEKLIPKGIVPAKTFAYLLTDKLTWFIVLGTVVGARLGHVFFYDWPRYHDNWLEIFKIWEGGLASHGGVVGVLLGVYLYYRFILNKFPSITLIGLLDCGVIPASLVAFFIRVGNFFNQEILGPPTTLPWGVIFGNPADGGPIVPRHPTQLYEAGAYLAIFVVLVYLWQKHGNRLRTGVLSGLCFLLIFSSRLFIDFIKTPQSLLIDESSFQMGQYLSLPFIIVGLALLFFGQKIDTRVKLPNRSVPSP